MKTLEKKWFLLQKEPAFGWSVSKTAVYWTWRMLFLLGLGAAMGYLTLKFAYGMYPCEIFEGYLASFDLVVLNLLPTAWLVFFLYALLGRAWLAFALGASATLALTLGNFFKILFRDDPLYFEDLLILREAGKMAGGYDIFIDRRIILAVLCVAGGTVLLALLARGAMKNLKCRAVLLLTALVSGGILFSVCADDHRYELTDNYEYLNRWSPTQNYISHGFVYPFVHSISEVINSAPTGYSRREAETLLADYEDADIPDAQKVNFITIMREAYVDFSRYDVDGLDTSVYDSYHALLDESYSGSLLTNIFAGGTVDTERGFLTGCYDLGNVRANTNSYLWYLREQGYTVEGSHPYYQWFYNRINVNEFLGFERYRYLEEDYEQLTKAFYPEDGVLFSEIYNDYSAARKSGKPYFSFSVTVQSHGPYETASYAGEREYLTGNYSTACKNAMNNYLNILADCDRELMALVETLRADPDPVVLVVFSDHLPWMGDGNLFYEEMGMDVDVSEPSEESFRRRYQTDYFIWANDAAKKTLGNDFVGNGPTISPCYLMNLVFDRCGWEGPGYMQAMREMMTVFPVVSTRGFLVENGKFTDTVSDERREQLADLRILNHYRRRIFSYNE